MVARTVVETTCDFCADEGRDNVKGETITIGGSNFDACSKHRKMHLHPLEVIVERYGRPVDEIAFTIAGPKAGKVKASKVKASKVKRGGAADSIGEAIDKAVERDRLAAERQKANWDGAAAPTKQRVICNLCAADVAFGSRSYHAKQHHSLRASQVEWTEA